MRCNGKVIDAEHNFVVGNSRFTFGTNPVQLLIGHETAGIRILHGLSGNGFSGVIDILGIHAAVHGNQSDFLTVGIFKRNGIGKSTARIGKGVEIFPCAGSRCGVERGSFEVFHIRFTVAKVSVVVSKFGCIGCNFICLFQALRTGAADCLTVAVIDSAPAVTIDIMVAGADIDMEIRVVFCSHLLLE